MSAFSTRLRELRQKACLSQQGLSNIIGISKSSINMYERGEREPGLETVSAFADFFDVQTDYLLGKHNDQRSVKEGRKYNKIILKTVDEYRQRHGYEREQLEELLDWEGLYSSLENDLILGDEGILKIIQNSFEVLDSPEGSIPVSNLLEEKSTPDELQLTEGERGLIELFRQIPEEKQELALEMIRVALGGKKQ